MTVLAAVDGKPGSERVVDAANELARRIGTELLVLHVDPAHAFAELDRAASAESADADETGSSDPVDEAAAAAREIAADVLDDTSSVTFRGRIGDPVEEIVDETERSDVDYLVIGGRQRSPVGKAVFGSVTQSLLLDAAVPVTIVNLED